MVSLDVVPIANINPSLSSRHDVAIRAIVTLIWPYSSSTQSCALLLAERDFRLRRRKGQVRVQLFKKCALELAGTGIGIGDEVLLNIADARWNKDAVSVSTPGKSVDWELHFSRKLAIEVFRDGASFAHLEVDDLSIDSETALAAPAGTPRSRAQRLPQQAPSRSSPAFLKPRLSDGTYFEAGYDPLLDQRALKRRRTSWRGSSEWKLVDGKPSPIKGNALLADEEDSLFGAGSLPMPADEANSPVARKARQRMPAATRSESPEKVVITNASPVLVASGNNGLSSPKKLALEPRSQPAWSHSSAAPVDVHSPESATSQNLESETLHVERTHLETKTTAYAYSDTERTADHITPKIPEQSMHAITNDDETDSDATVIVEATAEGPSYENATHPGTGYLHNSSSAEEHSFANRAFRQPEAAEVNAEDAAAARTQPIGPGSGVVQALRGESIEVAESPSPESSGSDDGEMSETEEDDNRYSDAQIQEMIRRQQDAYADEGSPVNSSTEIDSKDDPGAEDDSDQELDSEEEDEDEEEEDEDEEEEEEEEEEEDEESDTYSDSEDVHEGRPNAPSEPIVIDLLSDTEEDESDAEEQAVTATNAPVRPPPGTQPHAGLHGALVSEAHEALPPSHGWPTSSNIPQLPAAGFQALNVDSTLSESGAYDTHVVPSGSGDEPRGFMDVGTDDVLRPKAFDAPPVFDETYDFFQADTKTESLASDEVVALADKVKIDDTVPRSQLPPTTLGYEQPDEGAQALYGFASAMHTFGDDRVPSFEPRFMDGDPDPSYMLATNNSERLESQQSRGVSPVQQFGATYLPEDDENLGAASEASYVEPFDVQVDPRLMFDGTAEHQIPEVIPETGAASRPSSAIGTQHDDDHVPARFQTQPQVVEQHDLPSSSASVARDTSSSHPLRPMIIDLGSDDDASEDESNVAEAVEATHAASAEQSNASAMAATEADDAQASSSAEDPELEGSMSMNEEAPHPETPRRSRTPTQESFTAPQDAEENISAQTSPVAPQVQSVAHYEDIHETSSLLHVPFTSSLRRDDKSTLYVKDSEEDGIYSEASISSQSMPDRNATEDNERVEPLDRASPDADINIRSSVTRNDAEADAPPDADINIRSSVTRDDAEAAAADHAPGLGSVEPQDVVHTFSQTRPSTSPITQFIDTGHESDASDETARISDYSDQTSRPSSPAMAVLSQHNESVDTIRPVAHRHSLYSPPPYVSKTIDLTQPSSPVPESESDAPPSVPDLVLDHRSQFDLPIESAFDEFVASPDSHALALDSSSPVYEHFDSHEAQISQLQETENADRVHSPASSLSSNIQPTDIEDVDLDDGLEVEDVVEETHDSEHPPSLYPSSIAPQQMSESLQHTLPLTPGPSQLQANVDTVSYQPAQHQSLLPLSPQWTQQSPNAADLAISASFDRPANGLSIDGVDEVADTAEQTHPCDATRPEPEQDSRGRSYPEAIDVFIDGKNTTTPTTKKSVLQLGTPSALSHWFTPRQSLDVNSGSPITAQHQAKDQPLSTWTSAKLEQAANRQAPPEQAGMLTPPSTKPKPERNAHTASGSPLPSSQQLSQPGLRTSLSYYTPLSSIHAYLNTKDSKFDVLAVCVSATTRPERAPKGPRDYYTSFSITDCTIAHSRRNVQIFRPWKAALPSVRAGDVVLLRQMIVKGYRTKKGETAVRLLSSEDSAWCVWRFAVAPGEVYKPVWARSKDEEGYGEEDIRGPPVEIGEEEREKARGLSEWWKGEGREVVDDV